MRKIWLSIVVLPAMAFSGLSYALEASDSMAVWKGASAKEKTRLVTELLKKENRESATSSVVKCLDAAAEIPGHGDLPVREIIKACEKESGEPV